MTDGELVAAFEAGTVSQAQWTHRAHLRVAFVYLERGSEADALARMRTHLKAIQARFAIEDGLERGYHETVTVAWLRLVAAARRGYGPYETADAMLEAHPHLLCKSLLRLFYRRATIVTERAKREFVPGDLASLPEAEGAGAPAT